MRINCTLHLRSCQKTKGMLIHKSEVAASIKSPEPFNSINVSVGSASCTGIIFLKFPSMVKSTSLRDPGPGVGSRATAKEPQPCHLTMSNLRSAGASTRGESSVAISQPELLLNETLYKRDPLQRPRKKKR